MERTLAALSLSFEELAERVSPAVVQIIARGLAPTQRADCASDVTTRVHNVQVLCLRLRRAARH